jgi:uncharacterized protein
MNWSPLPICCVSLLLFVLPTSAQNCCSQTRLITVTGTAEINVAPDEVILNLGVVSRDKDLATAKAEHDSHVKKLIADARNAGVDQKDIQTNALRMTADYSEEKIPRFLAYEVTQTVQVKLKDLSKYESLSTKVLQDGVNRIDSVEFEVAETRKYKDEVRLKALRAAREKATVMAAELGQSVGKPWSILENNVSPYSAGLNANFYLGYNQAPVAEESTVAPGEVSIRASVNVSFELQ